jgi:hypothetical protein
MGYGAQLGGGQTDQTSACVACVTAAPALKEAATIAASAISVSVAPAFLALLL